MESKCRTVKECTSTVEIILSGGRMDDRFKFRVWNKENKKLYDWDFLEKTKGENTFFWVMHQAQNDCKHNILMQCTGLKDKNGKLIYEKDIIRFYFDNDEIIAVIEWDNDECRFYLNTTDFFKDKYVTDYEIVKQEEYEVIGNIYQDSHLIEN